MSKINDIFKARKKLEDEIKILDATKKALEKSPDVQAYLKAKEELDDKEKELDQLEY